MQNSILCREMLYGHQYNRYASLYQMTKSYCIELDENGEIKNYTVISGEWIQVRRKKKKVQ